MPGCVYNPSWEKDARFKDWLERDKSDKHCGYCKVCKKSLKIDTMTEGALTSHMKGKKHVRNMESVTTSSTVRTLFQPQENNVVTAQEVSVPSSSPTMDDFVSKTDVLKAEII